MRVNRYRHEVVGGVPPKGTMGRNQKMGIDAPTRVELEEYLRFTPRRRRYRDADKTFRFFVYQILELYVAMALILGFAAVWLPAGAIRSLCTAGGPRRR